ncbi:hypothetical protein LOTGIDRAFT_157070 [Lottia gigantea]|uniref:Uncharacterized protein n=1 Tax=Lottia gigantea TaxID=225164 RepID=V4CIF7_LOTGI|nr:hypothetical protein LOTGIDRAFT_157070 [Lottia gigantea]ESP01940.1 hypothetical protein LOTGIDRAFT_157070 [Lottia gigantea]
MGAKCSSPLKRKWFSRKSGNVKRNSVVPLQVKSAEDIDGPVNLLRTRSPKLCPELSVPSSPKDLDVLTVKSKDLDLAGGEYNEDDTSNVEHPEVHYEEIKYSVPAEIKTHYFNSFSQEWYVYKRTQQVPITEMRSMPL